MFDAGRIGLREAFQKQAIVQSQRTLQRGPAGERHQSEPVSAFRAHRPDQLAHHALGVLQAIGRDILGEHAERGIEHDHQVAPAARHVLFGLAPLRLHQCDDQAHGRRHQAERLEPPAGAIDPRQQAPGERALDERRQRPAPAPEAVAIEREQKRQQCQQIDAGERLEPHGGRATAPCADGC